MADMDQSLFPLLAFPNEILGCVASHLGRYSLYSLMRTNRRLSSVASPHLRRAFVKHRNRIVRFAAGRNNGILMQRAIDCGAYVPLWPLLQESVVNGWDNTARIILALGSDFRDVFAPQIVLAVTNRHINVTRVILEHGVGANTLSQALYTALVNNCMDIVELLLEYGADITTLPNPKRLFIDVIRRGNIPMMKVFCDAGMLSDMSPCSRNGDPVHVVAQVGSVEMMELLIEHGASVDTEGKNGNTPLHQTVMRAGRGEMLRFLLDNAANMNLKNTRGNTPLHLAVCRGNVEAVRILLEYGAEVGTVRMHQWEPVRKRMSGREPLGSSEDVKRVLVEFGVELDG